MGFLLLILLGTLLLSLPLSVKNGRKLDFTDALFTSASAVCVTGLSVTGTGETFTFFGRMVILILIQTGGLGIAFAGAFVFLLAGKRIGFKGRLLVKEAFNIEHTKGMIVFVKQIAYITATAELLGAAVSFCVFFRDYPVLKAAEISVFHSISAFCNAGFDILGGRDSLFAYTESTALNIVTAVLIFTGGIGYPVILELLKKRSFRKLNLHSKIVLTASGSLILFGTLMLWLLEKIPLLSAWFYSISARTAGFSTAPLEDFSNAGLFLMALLMFIGASPGSAGGGIKTSTFFVILCCIRSYITNQPCAAFRREIADSMVLKAFVICFLSLMCVCTGNGLISVLEPGYSFLEIMFETVSAFATAGLSAGITPYLGTAAKLILIGLMFAGRVGILTIACAWTYKPPAKTSYSQEHISIG